MLIYVCMYVVKLLIIQMLNASIALGEIHCPIHKIYFKSSSRLRVIMMDECMKLLQMISIQFAMCCKNIY